jgi:hypothetical protein
MKLCIRLTLMIILSGALLMPVVAAEDGQASPHTFLKRTDSVIIVWNEDPAFFRLEFAGLNIRRSIKGNCGVWVSDHFYDINVDDVTVFDGAGLGGAELLRAHMQHISQTWAEEAGMEMPLSERSVGTPLDENMALWEIVWSKKARKALRDRKSAGSVEKVLYLSVAVGERIVLISRPILKGEDAEQGYSYLAGIAESFQSSEKEINVGRVQREIQ